MDSRDLRDKLNAVIERNTFFIPKSDEVEGKYSNLLSEIKNTIKELSEIIKTIDLKDENQLIDSLTDFLQKNEHGLNAFLALSGMSYEKLYRIISFLRIMYKKRKYKTDSIWLKEDVWSVRKGKVIFSEWKEDKIKSKIKEDRSFAEDIVKIFLGKNEFVNAQLSEFEKGYILTIDKLQLHKDALIDTLVRYSLSGRYAASKGTVPEEIVKGILDELNIPYESGKVEGIGRKIDVVIPSKDNPKIFIEISYVETTSSGMGDKAKTERDTVRKNIKGKYKDATFIVFVNGAGWLTREEALKVMCEAGDYVFTFHEKSLEEFKELMKELKKKYNIPS